MGCCISKSQTSDSTSSTSHYIQRPSATTVTRDDSSSSARQLSEDPTLLYLDCNQCTVNWRLSDTTVGSLNVAEISLVRRNGTSYKFQTSDCFQTDVCHRATGSEVNCVIEPTRTLVDASTITVSFTARLSGEYTVAFIINGTTIGRVYTRTYQAGPPDPSRTVFHVDTTNLILKCDTYYPILFSPLDCYGNVATMDQGLVILEAKQNDQLVNPAVECVVNQEDDGERYELLVKLTQPGYYICCVKYMNRTIGLENYVVICLSDTDYTRMDRNLNSLFLNIGYKARLITGASGRSSGIHRNGRKVKCFISPRVFQVRENRLLISTRVFTCRVCNSTQFIFHSECDKFTIDDGLQPPVTLISADREIMAAVFHKFIQTRIGGADSFQEKVRHFQQELQKDNSREDHVDLRVIRADLLQSAMHATRRFTVDMWKRRFFVRFEGESGIDAGGVSREFFNCLCDTLFSGRNPKGLFMRFKDDPQALVHPNHSKKRDKSFTMEHYRFAGRVVGKCLFDTALGNRLLVRAKFTRSFLAQIIGLRLSWKHFETDDPDLYQFKVTSIRDSNMVDLELSLAFAEEDFDVSEDCAVDPKLVPLIPGGANVPVTDANKMDYLNQLAQYRLAKRVAEEVKEFLKGLHELIPDDLLGIFDENELELLMCGVQELNFEDLRAHTQVRQSNDFRHVVDWFWTAVEEFSQEELARLVQFVTGSSQIPVGGFRELQPPFLLVPSGERGYRLPYAHTCFNHLCLPECDTYEQFRRALLTAINEGSEGVLMS